MSIEPRRQTKPRHHDISIIRTVGASPDKVFRAWLHPAHLSHWWGPRDFSTPHVEVDPKPGGTFRTCIRSTQGDDYWARGTFREIDAPRRLVFTHAWEGEREAAGDERLVTVEFTEIDGKTQVAFLIGGFDSSASRDSEIDGWNECLDRLVLHFAEARTTSDSNR